MSNFKGGQSGGCNGAPISAGASYIAQGLSNQKSLIQLHLGGNKIGDQGLVSIGMYPNQPSS